MPETMMRKSKEFAIGSSPESVASPAKSSKLGALKARMKSKGVKNKEQLAHDLAEVEGRLKVTDKLVEFLQNSLAQAEEEKHNEVDKAIKLEKHLKVTKDRLEEKEKQVTKLAKELQLKTKLMAETEAHLNKSYNETLECHQAIMNQTAEEKQELEKLIADLEFQVTETNRVLRFQEVGAAKLQEQKKLTEEESTQRIAELEFQLSSVNRVASFAQDAVRKIQTDKNRYENEAERKIAELAFRLAEAERITKFLQERYNGSEARSGEEISELKFNLTQANQMVMFLQGRLKTTEEETKDKITDLEYRLSGSERVNKFVHSKVEADNERTSKRIAELEAELTQANSTIAVLKNRSARMEARLIANGDSAVFEPEKDQSKEVAELRRQVRSLEGRLRVSNKVNDYLQNLVSTAEEERLVGRLQ